MLFIILLFLFLFTVIFSFYLKSHNNLGLKYISFCIEHPFLTYLIPVLHVAVLLIGIQFETKTTSEY